MTGTTSIYLFNVHIGHVQHHKILRPPGPQFTGTLGPSPWTWSPLCSTICSGGSRNLERGVQLRVHETHPKILGCHAHFRTSTHTSLLIG